MKPPHSKAIRHFISYYTDLCIKARISIRGKEKLNQPNISPAGFLRSFLAQQKAATVEANPAYQLLQENLLGKRTFQQTLKKEKALNPLRFKAFGAARQIRTADLILTKPLSGFLSGVCSCCQTPGNPLQRKRLPGVIKSIRVIWFYTILGHIIGIVGRFVGKFPVVYLLLFSVIVITAVVTVSGAPSPTTLRHSKISADSSGRFTILLRPH